MRVCIVSDSHDRAKMRLAAVADAKHSGAEAVVHCADLIGANTLRPRIALGLPVHAVHGNDPAALYALHGASGGLLTYHGPDAELQLGGRRIFATHHPHYAHGVARTGEYDLVCCGHSHRVSIEAQYNVRGGRTWLVNPGTVAGLAAPATWVLGDLDALAFEVRSVPAEETR